MRERLALLSIELRRSTGLWLFPLLAVLIGYTATEELPDGVWLWPHTGVALQSTLVVAGPVAAGLGTWVATRNRRRNMQELLASTPRPAALRELAPWAAVAAWVCLGYVLATVVLFAFTLLGANWGSPSFGPAFAGLFALCMHSALGYAAGHFVPRRFTVPLVAVFAYVAQGLVGFSLGSYLSPVAAPFPDAFYGVFPSVSTTQSLWFISASAVALGLITVRGRERTLNAWLTLAAFSTVALIAATVLLRTQVPFAPTELQASQRAYEPVCVKQKNIPVCVHPAYEELLPEVAPIVAEMTEPLVGVSGGPIRAEQVPTQPARLRRDGTLEFFLYDRRSGGEVLATDLGYALVQDEHSYESNRALTRAQSIVAGSLARSTGAVDPVVPFPGLISDADIQASARFSRLPVEEQRRWFQEHYALLRRGQLDFKELP